MSPGSGLEPPAGGPSSAAEQRAAEFFRALATPARVSILRRLVEPMSVTALAHQTGLSQPLVSQHLRILRSAGMVAVERTGRVATYRVHDAHVTHVVEDAVAHVSELDRLPDE